MENVIEVNQAVKRFKGAAALDEVSMSFSKGKIHGIIGRNGSGKTVLFKCICGFMKLDSGRILLRGKEVEIAAAQQMGIILENPGFIGSMSGFKNLKMLASIRNQISNQRIRECIEMVGLNPDDKKAVRKYSLGMRHRLGIAQAIMEDPDIMILDEPMNGLDKQGVLEIRQIFRDLRDQGKTIILSSHYAEDIDLLCDTVHEMDNGKVINAPS